MKAKILVTGGTGFIGSHTVVALIEAGYEVLVVDNLSNSYNEALIGIHRITGVLPHFFELDLRDKDKVIRFFRQHDDIAGVIHFAALKAVGESVKQPLAYYENNLSSLLHLLE